METLGLSLDDATKVITVSTAFRFAAARTRASINQGVTNNNIAIEAIDDLTSRLNLANLLRGGGGASSPIPTSPRPLATATLTTATTMNSIIGSNLQATEVAVDAFQSRRSSSNMATAKKDQRTTASMESKNSQQPQQQQHGGGRGRKRALADKTPELCDSNVMITNEKPSTTTTKAIDPVDVKEQILNAKLSKVEGSTSTSSSGVASARSKSPDGGGGGIGGARGMRGASTVSVHHDVEQSLASKRPRTRSQTEESIPEI